MIDDDVVIDHRGKTFTARCVSANVAAGGEARSSSAFWEVEVDGTRSYGFPFDPDLDAKAELRAWAGCWFTMKGL